MRRSILALLGGAFLFPISTSAQEEFCRIWSQTHGQREQQVTAIQEMAHDLRAENPGAAQCMAAYPVHFAAAIDDACTARQAPVRALAHQYLELREGGYCN